MPSTSLVLPAGLCFGRVQRLSAACMQLISCLPCQCFRQQALSVIDSGYHARRKARLSEDVNGSLLCLRRVVAHPKLFGTMTKSLHSMSPGFGLAAARQASTGSSESCQDCFQYTRQSLMNSKGCEDTREDPVPPQAKRYNYGGTVHHHPPAIEKITTSKHFGLHCLI